MMEAREEIDRDAVALKNFGKPFADLPPPAQQAVEAMQRQAATPQPSTAVFPTIPVLILGAIGTSFLGGYWIGTARDDMHLLIAHLMFLEATVLFGAGLVVHEIRALRSHQEAR